MGLVLAPLVIFLVIISSVYFSFKRTVNACYMYAATGKEKQICDII